MRPNRSIASLYCNRRFHTPQYSKIKYSTALKKTQPIFTSLTTETWYGFVGKMFLFSPAPPFFQLFLSPKPSSHKMWYAHLNPTQFLAAVMWCHGCGPPLGIKSGPRRGPFPASSPGRRAAAYPPAFPSHAAPKHGNPPRFAPLPPGYCLSHYTEGRT